MARNVPLISGGFMPQFEKDEAKSEPIHHPPKFSRIASHEKYTEPEPILDPTCGFEEVDRGEGMAVDDIKEYHRTEK
jgi:hypothetical protein